MNPFFQADEQQAVDAFLRDGYYRFDLNGPEHFETLRARLHGWGCELLEQQPSADRFFNHTEGLVDIAGLNDFRLGLIRKLNADETIRPLLYNLARRELNWLVGSELAMQRSLNLSIQLPGDASSLLPLHADIWSGNSPYEVVFWLPLTRVHGTRSMFVLPKPKSDRVYADFKNYSDLSVEAFYREIEADLTWIELEPGQGLIFWHGLIHGNRVNREAETRWTMNTRFKGLLSPYGQKELGESFLPITTRPITRIGYAYRNPQC
ncbi:MAG: hypothetical protein QNK37_32420 [Acidobacteriota bacterium]|nr:hypothetical protein [Acidobacteriota bacterium]